MGKLIEWRIYYDDKPPYTNLDGGPADAPAVGVQAIAQLDRSPSASNVGRMIVHQEDYYWCDPDSQEWFGGNLGGLYVLALRMGFIDPEQDAIDSLNIIHQMVKAGIVKVGSIMPRDEWRAVYRQAIEDAEFPRKSGYKPKETKKP